jgi:threonine dehydrogenase-like Zn-dependent dehydrogenase
VRGAWLEAQTLSYHHQLSEPAPAEGEALVEVLLTGVCSTDLELLRGYYPFTGVPGHEFVGRVISSPSDESWVGRRVVGEINLSCGKCPPCRAGLLTHCEMRTVLGIRERGGAFAERLTLPLSNLHAVPRDLVDEAAVFCEPLAAALEIQEQVPVHPGQRVLVVGAGRLGQLVAQTLALTGCHLQVVARHARQRSLLEACDISWIGEDLVPTHSVDIVVEATGTPSGFTLARQAVRPRGTIVLKSTYKGEMQVNFSALVVDEIMLVGSRCGPFAPALRLLETGRVSVSRLVEARYPLEQVEAAFEHAARPGALKVLIDPKQA